MIYRGTVKRGVIELEDGATLPEGTPVKVERLEPQASNKRPGASLADLAGENAEDDAKPPRSSLADWAEENAENWGTQLDSTDVASFTGRNF